MYKFCYSLSLHTYLLAVFWGGREGFQTLLNTDVHAELSHMASFFRMAVGKLLSPIAFVLWFCQRIWSSFTSLWWFTLFCKHNYLTAVFQVYLRYLMV